MTVSCSNCGKSWPRDPALEVECPTCGRGVGKKCQRPSGHPCSLHASRDKLALREVDGYEVCTESTAEPEVDTSIESGTKQATLPV